MNKEFSIVIPLYNKERYIKRAINSVLAQTYGHFEIVVIDDGSVDRSVDVVNDLKDARIRLLKQAHHGVSKARNKGIAEARYDLLAFLDADDWWRPQFLATINDLVSLYPQAGAYVTSYDMVELSGRKRIAKTAGLDVNKTTGIIKDFFKSASLGDPPISASSVCLKKDTLQSVGGFPEGVDIAEDFDLWIRIALDYDIAYSTFIGATYDRGAQGRSCRLNLPGQDELSFLPIIEKAIQEGRIQKHSVFYAQELIALHQYLNSIRFLLSNQRGKALFWLRKIKTKRLHQKIKNASIFLLSHMPKFVINWIRRWRWGF